MTYLFLALRWLRSGLSALVGLIARYPWQAILIASLCLSAVLWRSNMSKDRQILSMKAEHAKFVATSDAAAKAQKALNAKVQNTYQEQADGAQERHDTRSPGVRSATDRYILAHRVQPSQCGPGKSNPASGGGDPGVSAPVPGDSLVLVDELDVRACADATAYAVSAYEFASGLIKAGVAK